MILLPPGFSILQGPYSLEAALLPLQNACLSQPFGVYGIGS